MEKDLNINCCGCTTCHFGCPVDAIELKEDTEGFLAPFIDEEKCISCGLCVKNCKFKDRLSNGISRSGFEQKYYVLRRKNLRKRLQSQSGGAFASMAEVFLLRNAAVYGVRQKEDFTACYTRIDNVNQLPSLMGSKYVQAEMNNIFENVYQDLAKDIEVFFGGTACCIDGLYQYLNIKKCKADKLVTCDIICHGVPSPMLVRDYIKDIEKKYDSKVSAFNYRDKRLGWHGHNESFQLENKRLVISQNNVKIFYSHLCLRESCYKCPYAVLNRISDISIGDCWGIENIMPEFDDNRGCSLVLVNSDKGCEAFDSIRDDIEYQQVCIDKVLQPNLLHPTPKPEKRNDFWERYYAEGFEKTVEEYCGYNTGEDSDFKKIKNVLRLIKDQITRKLRQYRG